MLDPQVPMDLSLFLATETAYTLYGMFHENTILQLGSGQSYLNL